MKMMIDVDINPNDYEWYDEENLKDDIKEAIKERILDNYSIWKDLNLSEMAQDILKENQDYIVNEVIKQVSEKIERKRDIVANTPKVTELKKINKENEEYISNLIEKCIAKKFK